MTSFVRFDLFHVVRACQTSSSLHRVNIHGQILSSRLALQTKCHQIGRVISITWPGTRLTYNCREQANIQYLAPVTSNTPPRRNYSDLAAQTGVVRLARNTRFNVGHAVFITREIDSLWRTTGIK